MPCKIYLQVWILEFVGPLAPPAPHRLLRKELFLGNLSGCDEIQNLLSHVIMDVVSLLGYFSMFRKLVKPRKMFLFF